MHPVNVQLSGKVTAVDHDRGSGYMTIKYDTGDVEGSLRISARDAVNIRRISKPVGRTLKVEYSGARPVGVQIGRTVILARPGSSEVSPTLG